MSSFVAVLAAAAAAMPALLPDTYALLCQSEQSTGFNWRGGNWVAVNFKSDAYVFEARKENICLGMKPRDDQFGAIRFRTICGNVREVGKPYSAPISMECTERYTSNSGQPQRSIECSKDRTYFAAEPDGWFHNSYTHADVERRPTKDYKDSLSVTVGKCSMVTGSAD